MAWVRKSGRWTLVGWVVTVAFLGSCASPDKHGATGVLVLDESLELQRGAARDSARREFPVTQDATYVAVIVEDDLDPRLRLERLAPGAQTPSAAIDVESRFMGEGIEVAALDVAAGDRLALALESPREYAQPRQVHVKLWRIDKTAQRDPKVRDRVRALQAWAAATRFEISAEEFKARGYADLDLALAHLQSADGDPFLAAWARLVRANCSYVHYLGWQQSLTDAKLATEAFRAIADARGIARARYAEATALFEIATDPKAVNPSAKDAEVLGNALFRELIDDPALSRRERARAINNLGYNAGYRKALAESQEHITRALEEFRAIGDRDGTRMALSNIATIAAERGELRTAVQMHDELFAQISEIALPERRAVYLYNAAFANLWIGNTDTAIERLLMMLRLARDAKLVPTEARALHGLAMAYWQRGDLAQANTFADQSLKIRRTVHDPAGMVGNLQVAGDIARDSGDTHKALALHGEALTLASNNDTRMRMLSKMASDHAAGGAYEQAIAMYRKALALPLENQDAFRKRAAELGLAEALLARAKPGPRDLQEAAALATRIIQGAIDNADIAMEQAARKVLAEALAARGEIAQARAEYQRAIALIFMYRATTASPEQQATLLVRTQDTFRGYIDLLMRDVVAQPAGHLVRADAGAEAALLALESARQVTFDSVATARVDAATQSRIDQLLARMAEKRVRMAAMHERIGITEADVESLKLDIARLRAEIDAERARRAPSSPGGDRIDWLVPALPPVRAGITQLSYALGKRHVYLWVRDGRGSGATTLVPSRAALEKEIGLLVAAGRASTPAAFDRQLTTVSGWMLPKDAVGADATSLEIVADGSLASVPFAALRAPRDGGPRLAELGAVVLKASILEQVRPREPGPHPLRFVGLSSASSKVAARPADVRRGFPGLPMAGSETASIAALFAARSASDVKLLSGAEGNAANVQALWRSGVNVFHFATHGLADLRQPLASLLLLPALADGQPTYLTAGQVQEWQGNVELVYLSACETAVGPARFADGMPGLQRAFLRAGADGVIATLWPVEDVYASAFATEFYRRYTAGQSPAQALSETQRAWISDTTGASVTEQSHRRLTAWAHAYYAR